MKYFLVAAVLAMLTLSSSCNLLTGPKKSSNVRLSAADVICTEVWLKISFADSRSGGSYQIKRNGTVVLTGSFTSTDTVLVDSTVQPSRSYNYVAYRIGYDSPSQTSSALQVTTLDSTSSNFSWQLYNFGNFNATGMASSLYSVAVISDTDLWAVGQIYISDSIADYNAVHWDRNKWRLAQIPLIGPCSGGVTYPPLRAATLYHDASIMVSDGGALIEYDRTEASPDCRMNSMLSGAIQAILVVDSTNIYAVGNSGAAVHYGRAGWNKILTGTTLNLFDTYSADGKNIYVAGGNFQDYSGILLEGNSNGFHTIEEGRNLPSLSQEFHPYFDGVAKTVWVSSAGTVYFGGNALYIYTGGETNEVRTLPGNRGSEDINGQYFGFISQIRGLAENEMIMVGEKNTIRYFNGVRWTQLGMPYDPSSGYTWLSVGMTHDLIVVVGYSTNGGMVGGASIIMLKRE